MLRKRVELPEEAALAFVEDMQAFFAAKNQLEEDEIAAAAGWRLKQHLPKGTRLRLSDVSHFIWALGGQTLVFH